MKIIGITGGIGSGKSTVADFISERGYPVYSSDQRAKQLMNESANIKNYLISTYGEEIYLNEELNRALLSRYVFKNSKALKNLNEIVHPEVFEDFNIWKKNLCSQLVFKEAAILFESGSYKNCDFTLTVEAEVELRIQRVMKRNNFTREQVENRINNQWVSEKRQNLADYVIFNNSDLKHLKNETIKFLDVLLNKYNIV